VWRVNNSESVHALASLYQTWQKAYENQSDPDLAAWWLIKWLDLLIARAYRPTTLCTPGLCLNALARKRHLLVDEIIRGRCVSRDVRLSEPNISKQILQYGPRERDYAIRTRY
jgi:hypothetical protein